MNRTSHRLLAKNIIRLKTWLADTAYRVFAQFSVTVRENRMYTFPGLWSLCTLLYAGIIIIMLGSRTSWIC